MKKIVFSAILMLISAAAFSQTGSLPVIMCELNSGYSIGINTDSGMQIDVKGMFLYDRFGVTLEAGSQLTPDKASFHLFLGPGIVVLNTGNWRMPVSIGMELFHGKTMHYGIGAIVSVHYVITDLLYAGLNLGLTYAFNNVTEQQKGPAVERTDNWGSYLYIRPSLVFGIQF